MFYGFVFLFQRSFQERHKHFWPCIIFVISLSPGQAQVGNGDSVSFSAQSHGGTVALSISKNVHPLTIPAIKKWSLTKFLLLLHVFFFLTGVLHVSSLWFILLFDCHPVLGLNHPADTSSSFSQVSSHMWIIWKFHILGIALVIIPNLPALKRPLLYKKFTAVL